MHDTAKIEVGEDVLAVNRQLGQRNHSRLDQSGTKAINIMGAIGSGKTSLIEYSLGAFKDKYRMAAVSGDVIADIDADRFKKFGVPVVPMNTGKECHLDAHLMEHALDRLDLPSIDLLFIENVGNLICPSDFYLGESSRVIVVSVTEGDDIVQKHPIIFKNGDLAIINKVDISQFVGADPDKMIHDALRNIKKAFKMSIRNGEGLDLWNRFIDELMRS
ncbi:MAG: hydrogenase nickel incorporation protein HypB [Thermodesulfobacteriota bacterium]|nr:hydrogenase nickel incorporation protein HypB [Thermodesulfobacteriota bacterium]